MKPFTWFLLTLFISAVRATTPHQGTLATNIQLPLCIGGKTVGAMSLKAGSEITIIKVDPDGVMIARGESTPVKVGRETLTSGSLAAAEATPVPTPLPTPFYPTPVAKSTPVEASSSESNNEKTTSKLEALVGTWTNIKSGYYQGGPNVELEIQSMGNITMKHEYNTPDGGKSMNSSIWHAGEAGDKITLERNKNPNSYYGSSSTYKQWYEIKLPFNLNKLELINCYVNPDGNSGTSTMFFKKMER